jgi:MerR family transcriptional regulator, copper efflux regulator
VCGGEQEQPVGVEKLFGEGADGRQTQRRAHPVDAGQRRPGVGHDGGSPRRGGEVDGGQQRGARYAAEPGGHRGTEDRAVGHEYVHAPVEYRHQPACPFGAGADHPGDEVLAGDRPQARRPVQRYRVEPGRARVVADLRRPVHADPVAALAQARRHRQLDRRGTAAVPDHLHDIHSPRCVFLCDHDRMLRLKVDVKSTAELTIGEVARRFGLAAHVLRHWEAMGLLSPARASGQRRYTDDDLYRIAAVLHAKQAGLSLDQIQQMITSRSPQRRAILCQQRDDLHGRIAAARRALDMVECALDCTHDDLTQCPRYRELVATHLTSG